MQYRIYEVIIIIIIKNRNNINASALGKFWNELKIKIITNYNHDEK